MKQANRRKVDVLKDEEETVVEANTETELEPSAIEEIEEADWKMVKKELRQNGTEKGAPVNPPPQPEVLDLSALAEGAGDGL
ncbi:hypothetical protein A2U01_0021156 [Trifolium medium]|uniref:Uncharacterized protein n=1 Tax=Trifolium medium TaxID=97028 RepID=A0A392NLZ6_9FABA|nr:hypothetical protein [Trifolium medium]